MKTITFKSGKKIITQSFVEKQKIYEFEDVIIEIPEGVEKIENNGFSFPYEPNYCYKNIVKVVIPNSCKSIGDYAFAHCVNLKEVELPADIQIGSYAFKNCNIENLKTDNLKIKNGFAFSDTDELLLYLANSHIKHCEIPDGVKFINNDAFSCTEINKITIPDSVVSIGESTFEWCEKLTNIIIPDSVQRIGEKAFFYNTNLESVIMPKTLTVIERCMFEACTKLKTITLPKNLEIIAERAFKDCKILKNMDLPKSLKKIEADAFLNCSAFKSFSLNKSVIVEKDKFNDKITKLLSKITQI